MLTALATTALVAALQPVPLCLGDSVTYGYALASPSTEAWCAQIGVPSYNAGVPRDTAKDGLARWDSDVASRRPTVVFIAFGLNDWYQFRNATDYAADIRKLINLTRGIGARPILVAPNPVQDMSWNAELRGHVDALRALAVAEHVQLVDVYSLLAQRRAEGWRVLADDYSHPDAQAHREIGTAARRALEEVLP